MSTATPTFDFTGAPTSQSSKKSSASAWIKYGGAALACLVLLVILYFVMSRKGSSGAPAAPAPALDKAQLLAAHATQLHKDLTGFQ